MCIRDRELGGKSANIVFADSDLEAAVTRGVLHCYGNTGQSCNAPTRMLVEQSVYDEAVAIAARVAKAAVLGDPMAKGPHYGPVVSKAHYDKIQGLIEVGIDEGAQVVAGGTGRADGFDRGYYVKPTVFAGVHNKMRIAQEEAKHFTLLRNHLVSMGFDYGDFPAHNTLWDMAERTQGDLLARIGIVPRTMEARGLDASPGVKNKLVSVGDHRAGDILDIILAEEIGHVAAGNRWYRYLCAQRGLDPVSTYAELIAQYDAPKLRPPFNMAARRLAGFEEVELAALS